MASPCARAVTRPSLDQIVRDNVSLAVGVPISLNIYYELKIIKGLVEKFNIQ